MRKKLRLEIKGYTLVELLSVIVILVVTGTIVSGILVTSLRGGNKGNVTNDIRQNGNFVVSQMSKMIAYARQFDGVSTDGTNYSDNCIVTLPPPPNPTPTPIPYKYVKIESFDGGTTIFSCNGASDTPPNTIASRSAASTSADSMIDSSKMRVDSCVFYCHQDNLSASPRIDIDFTISTSVPGLFTESHASIPFQTSVVPRN